MYSCQKIRSGSRCGHSVQYFCGHPNRASQTSWCRRNLRDIFSEKLVDASSVVQLCIPVKKSVAGHFVATVCNYFCGFPNKASQQSSWYRCNLREKLVDASSVGQLCIPVKKSVVGHFVPMARTHPPRRPARVTRGSRPVRPADHLALGGLTTQIMCVLSPSYALH